MKWMQKYACSVRLWLPVTAIILLIVPAASAVTIDWVMVGGAGNACDVQSQGCFGAVASAYRISKTEVTNAQYSEFLNAVAATDTNGLYYSAMGSIPNLGGITRSGSSGSFTYSAITGRANWPVNYVSFYDSLRFTNWLNNGQLTGGQDNTTTEAGAYTFSGIASVGGRNSGASIFLTNEDEWYKAAYYDVVSASYFNYSAGSDTQITCAAAGATANTANCDYVVGELTDVGSYTGSASPNGTFDQGGNVWEWNEAMVSTGRGERSGSMVDAASLLAASNRSSSFGTNQGFLQGFRVASVPEPGTGILLMAGLFGLACRQKCHS